MNAVQLDLFSIIKPDTVAVAAAPADLVLNGMYYERSTDKFVSFVLGRRHYECPAKGSNFPKEWRDRTMRERTI